MRTILCFSLLFAATILATVLSTERSTSAQLRTEVVSCTPPPPGMVAWWPGEGNGNDIRGENNGTLQGAVTFPIGEVEHAFNFAAVSNSGVIVPSSNALNPTEGTTLDAWVNPSSYPNTGPAVIRKDTSPGTTQYSLSIGDGTTAGVVACNIGGVGLVAGSAPLNQWSHLACTYDRQNIRLYVNGVEVASTAATTAIPTGAGNLVIGKQDGFTDRNFDGLIDEVAVFNYAFSPAQVLALYNAALSVNLSIQRVGSNVILTWPKGTLLEATNISGPWVTNNATSPYTNSATGLKKFYRTVQ